MGECVCGHNEGWHGRVLGRCLICGDCREFIPGDTGTKNGDNPNE